MIEMYGIYRTRTRKANAVSAVTDRQKQTDRQKVRIEVGYGYVAPHDTDPARVPCNQIHS